MISKVSLITFISIFSTFSGASLISGCTNKPNTIEKKSNQYINEINELSLKVEALEKILSQKKPSNLSIINQSNLIKSITLRVGSSDDRLRIYWSDETRTDLPCTKEQSTWVCG